MTGTLNLRHAETLTFSPVRCHAATLLLVEVTRGLPLQRCTATYLPKVYFARGRFLLDRCPTMHSLKLLLLDCGRRYSSRAARHFAQHLLPHGSVRGIATAPGSRRNGAICRSA